MKNICCLLLVLPLMVGLCNAQYNILNQPSASVRPYPNFYGNKQLPNAGQGGPKDHLASNYAAIVSTTMRNGGSTLVTGSGEWSTPGNDDFQHRAFYYGLASDPVFTLQGCKFTPSANGQTFHAPAGAMFNQSTSDDEIVIWSLPDNKMVQLYNFNVKESLPTSGGTITRGNGYCSIVDRNGSGVDGGSAASTAGLAPFANIIRMTEIMDVGHINHNLRGLVTCNVGKVWPATLPSGGVGQACANAHPPQSDTNRPANGSLFFLDYTFADLDCFNPAKATCANITKLNPVQYMLIEAATLYGITIEDTGDGNSIALGPFESEQSYYFYETHGFPGAVALAHRFEAYMGMTAGAGKCTGAFCNVLTRNAPGSLAQWNLSAWAGISNVRGGDVIAHMFIADPCVPMGMQGVSGGCVSAGPIPVAPSAPTSLTATPH